MFDEFLALGGFPEAVKQSDVSLLEQYWQDILYRDIFPRYGIRNIREIRELTLFLASNSPIIHSYKSLQGVAGVKSQMTVRSYLQALHDVFLFFPVDLFDYSVKRQIYNPSKERPMGTLLAIFLTPRNRKITSSVPPQMSEAVNRGSRFGERG